MSVMDLGRTRFAFSPLTECGESLYLLSSGNIHPLHKRWFDDVAPRLREVDLALLNAITPAHGWIASFFLDGATGPDTRIEDQLAHLADLSPGVLGEKIAKLWSGHPIPDRAKDVCRPGGARKIADALWDYWRAAIEPHWTTMRGVLEDDVAHRARTLSTNGMQTLLTGLHGEVSWGDQVMRIGERGFDDRDDETMDGAGMALLPSVFCWPHVVFHVDADRRANLVYPARGIGNLWGASPEEPDKSALGALLGRSRADILLALDVPRTTSDLAILLGQSPAAVSQHLSVLRRSAMATSWRAGRRVLYLRTDLAASVVEANSRTTRDSASSA